MLWFLMFCRVAMLSCCRMLRFLVFSHVVTQMRISKKPVKHLRWSFFAKIAHVWVLSEPLRPVSAPLRPVSGFKLIEINSSFLH